jgi:DNA-binding winged helix-turn-helix (wHTH) protein/Tfp pilus assembly protein PilF
MTPSVQFDFGPFRLDAANHELLREGRPVTLKPKALDLLRYLVENSGRVLSRDELLTKVWNGAVIEDASLSQNVYELRKVLGDQAGASRYIQNVPKRGYRFVADVQRRGPSPRRTLAILPFRLFWSSADHAHLGIGVADTLVTILTNLREILVRPITAVAGYVGTSPDPWVAGRALDVSMLLDGLIQVDGKHLRCTTRLVDVTSGGVIWAARFDENVSGIFTMQDAIAQRIADAIAPELDGRERQALTKRYTRSAAAYELFLNGRYNWSRATEESLWRAIGFFRSAIAEDPEYALAYVGIADAYTSLDWYGALSTRESNPQAIAAAEKAIALDDELAEAHASLAMARQYAWQWDGVEPEYRVAIALNPNYAPARQWYGTFLSFMGRFDEALESIRQAEALDPLSSTIGAQVALVQFFARDFRAGIAQVRKVLEADPSSVEANFYLAMLLEFNGQFEEAIQVYRLLPVNNPDFRAAMAHACGAAGQHDAAQKAVRDLLEWPATGYVPPFWLAVAMLGVGDVDGALTQLERAVQDPDDSLLALKVTPHFDPLRENARYQAVLARMKMP